MACEKFEYSITPIVAIQKSFFGMANEHTSLIDNLKKSKETILKLEIQLKAANDTIAQQEDRLAKAKTILQQLDKLEGNSRQTVDKLKEELEIERCGRRIAEEKVQQLGEQVDRFTMLAKVEVNQNEHEPENSADNLMEIDDNIYNPVNIADSLSSKRKAIEDVYSSTVTIGGEVFKNTTENDEIQCSPDKSEKNSSFRTELKIIESTLMKYVNRLVAKENKPYKRQRCLNKVIRTTEKLVSNLSTMVSEEWVSYELQSPETQQSQSPQPLPSLFSPIRLWEETNTESTPASSESLNLPSFSTCAVVPEQKSAPEKIGNVHEIDMSGNNKCICGHESTNQKALLMHINREIKGKLFRCEICENRSRDTTDLNLHYQKVHGVKSDYANGCGKCGKTFASKGNLRQHMLVHQKSGKVYDASAIKIRVHQ